MMERSEISATRVSLFNKNELYRFEKQVNQSIFILFNQILNSTQDISQLSVNNVDQNIKQIQDLHIKNLLFNNDIFGILFTKSQDIMP